MLAVDAITAGDAIHFGRERTLFEWDPSVEYDRDNQLIVPHPTVQPIRGGDSLFTTCWIVLDVAASSGTGLPIVPGRVTAWVNTGRHFASNPPASSVSG